MSRSVKTIRMFRLDLIKGADAPRRFHIHSGAAVIGSDDSTDIVLKDEGVQPRHATIEIRGDEAVVTDFDPQHPVFLNRQAVTEAVLRHQDALTIGEADLVFHHPADDPESRSRRMHHLQRITLIAVSLMLLLETAFLVGLLVWKKPSRQIEAAEPETSTEVPAPAEESMPTESAPFKSEPGAPPVAPVPPETAAATQTVKAAAPVETATSTQAAEAVESSERPEAPESSDPVSPEPVPEKEQAAVEKAKPPPEPEPPVIEPVDVQPSSYRLSFPASGDDLDERLSIERVDVRTPGLPDGTNWLVLLEIEVVNRSGRSLSISETIDVRCRFYYRDLEEDELKRIKQGTPDGPFVLQKSWSAGTPLPVHRIFVPPLDVERTGRIRLEGASVAVYLNGELQASRATAKALLPRDDDGL